LLAGTRAENAHLYYDLVKVAVIGDGHCVQLILNVPLKTASRYFVLHKIISLPAGISDDKFVQCLLDFTYIGLDNIQRKYILFTEADLSHCSKGSITVFSADKAIYVTQIVKSESSLFFLTTTYYKLRQRILLLHYKIPTLQRHGFVWGYHCTEQQHVTHRCWKNGSWVCRTEELSSAGVLYNVSVPNDEFQTVPDLLGSAQVIVDAPQLYSPYKIAVIADHELGALEEYFRLKSHSLIKITSEVTAPRQVTDVNTLLHVY
jgi:hypothetical protein